MKPVTVLPTARMALNPFKGLTPKEEVPDVIKKPQRFIDNQVKEAMGQYALLPPSRVQDFLDMHAESLRSPLDAPLTPDQIDIVAQMIVRHPRFHHERAGAYLTALIQHSYCMGLFDDFTLSMRDRLIDLIGYRLKGTQERMIRLTLIGDVGAWCGLYAEHCAYTIRGFVGDGCGYGSNDCVFSTPNEKTHRKLERIVPTEYPGQFRANGNRVILL